MALCAAFLVSLSLGGAEALAAPQDTKLGRYYAGLEQKLRAKGYLRRDRNPSDIAYGANSLAENFLHSALGREHGGRGGLMRWETPVRVRILFGDSVPQAQRTQDRQTIRTTAQRLQRATGHPVSVAQNGNFLVVIASSSELKAASRAIGEKVPGISTRALQTIARMPKNHLCLMVAVPHEDPRRGIRGAVAIVRAEHTERMRKSCIEEEMAQGMGLPNDWRGSRPSIFNDDEEFAVLTRHDETMLSMLYSRQFSSGMTRAMAAPIAARLAQSLR